MLTPLPKKTFYAIVSRWARIITLNGESAIEIWQPLELPEIRIRQFIADKNLQKKLFPKGVPHLVEVNGHNLNNFTFEEFQKQVGFELHHKDEEKFSLEKWLTISKKPLALFLVGFDLFLQKKHFEVLNYLSTLSHKYPRLSIILFTSQDISLTPLYKAMQLDNLLGNVFYQSVFSFDDSMHFFTHMQEQWNLHIPKKIKQELVTHLQGHLLLIKAAVRHVRDNRSAKTADILSSTAIKQRGLAIFNGLNHEDKKIIIDTLESKTIQPSQYLRETKLVNNKTVGLPYWKEIKSLLTEAVESTEQNFSHKLHVSLTSIERETLDIFMENASIVTREQIAKTIWRNEWMERYSNWAIDQLIHRIRGKLKKTKAPYEILTKKGEGFYLKRV